MRSEQARHVVAALMSVALVASSSVARAQCKNDGECKGDRVCEKGVCVSPPAPRATPSAPPASPSAPPASPSAPAPAPAPAPAAAASVPAPFTVDVTVTNGDGEVVTLEGLHARQSCRTPCSVQVPPGRYFVKTKSFSEEVDVPSHSTSIAMKRACLACYIGGGSALALGLASPSQGSP